MTTPPAGLRERKKQATREALREAALRLAVERGPDQVRVEDIAEAAGVSPRTYNNYFASREQAIVSAVTADREAWIAAAVAARPVDVRLADAVTEAVAEQYANVREGDERALLLITTRAALREAFLGSTADIEPPLAAAIAERLGDTEGLTARVLAASVAAAVRIGLEGWLRPARTDEAAGSSGTVEGSDAAGSSGAVGGSEAAGSSGTVGGSDAAGSSGAVVGSDAAGGSGVGGGSGVPGGFGAGGLVVPTGSLADRLRAALSPLAPAFDAAERSAGRGH
ncbi:TetR/AcrR family transcriptional regulator [Streptomyces sp. E-08]|uniref:TetR/AcrR family transcriptional regulator n=1 Tax=Streptomyces sp. E-08 TaxID=3404047 RepID=UPI003CFBBFF9